MDTKYPKEIYSAVRNQTFAVSSELYRAVGRRGESPLKVYNGFSRMVFCIINENKESLTANLPVWECANIRELTRIAQNIDTQLAFRPQRPQQAQLKSTTRSPPADQMRRQTSCPASRNCA